MSALSGRKILITRAEDASREVSALLEKHGALATILPAVRFADPDSWEACDAAIVRLRKYHGIIFTSATAVDFFLNRLDAVNADAKTILDSRLLYAVGDRTANTLVSRHLVPAGVGSGGTAEELAGIITGDLTGRHFLFPRSNIARDVIPRLLRERNAVVDDVIVYKTIAPAPKELDPLRSALKNGEVDAVLFYSPSAIINSVQMLGSGAFDTTTVAVVGPTTAEAARSLGLRVSVIAARPSTADLIDALERHFATFHQSNA